MAVSLKSTGEAASNGVKILAYGGAGVGKTRLIPTLPDVVVLSAEGGLLSIQDSNTPYIEITCPRDIGLAYEWLVSSDEAKQFESVALDSISEVAEQILTYELGETKDGRAAYGNMQTRMTSLIRSFRDLPGRNVYFSAKLDKAENEAGFITGCPDMPGKTLAKAMPYFFDEVFAIRIEKNAEGQDVTVIQTSNDISYGAKDRSGKLKQYESYELGLGGIIEKIKGMS